LIGCEKAFPGMKSQPGVFISDQDGRILYINEAARRFFDTLREKHISCRSFKNACLREVLSDLLSEFKQRSDLHGAGLNASPPTVISRNFMHKGIFHHVRSIPLKPHGANHHDGYLLLLIEEINESIS
jgi:hypothetical protein